MRANQALSFIRLNEDRSVDDNEDLLMRHEGRKPYDRQNKCHIIGLEIDAYGGLLLPYNFTSIYLREDRCY